MKEVAHCDDLQKKYHLNWTLNWVLARSALQSTTLLFWVIRSALIAPSPAALAEGFSQQSCKNPRTLAAQMFPSSGGCRD